MELSKKERLNLIHSLSQTSFYEQLPKKLEENEIGLDCERWSDLIQRLIDNTKVWGIEERIFKLENKD